jgi:xanthine dehydrogenase FAD-binding subunit
MAVLLPTELDELLDLLARPTATPARIMAGGTDLLVRLRASGDDPGDILCLERIPVLRAIDITATAQGAPAVRIGAATPLTAIESSEPIRERLPLLHRAARAFASPQVRAMATIGGNICTASPAGDTLPALYAMDAEVELTSPDGRRTLPIDRFITGPGGNALKTGELLTSILVPVPEGCAVHHFEKVGRRAAMAIAVVSLAALVAVENGAVTRARFAWGSVGPTIVRCREAEELLADKPLTLTALTKAAEAARDAMAPISDVRASADYRRQVAGNLLLRLAAL